MSGSLYWLQAGGCGGDTWSAVGADSPDLVEALRLGGIEVLWHPSLSRQTPAEHRRLVAELSAGERPLDVFCVEGAVVRGPGGTGMFDTVEGRPKKALVEALARRARFVVAVGTCASFGGLGGDAEVEATGLQFTREVRGGFLGADFTSGAGLPVVNLPGCPCHPEVLVGTLTALLAGAPPPLTERGTPAEWYETLVHQGCSRNEYHEYRVEESDFGGNGCLYFHMGCRGPMTWGPCNKLLWNRRSSKTRAGVPCFGCTEPDFPRPHPFFRTRNIAGIPIELPEGVDRAHFLAYKGMAAAAAPVRLKRRENRV